MARARAPHWAGSGAKVHAAGAPDRAVKACVTEPRAGRLRGGVAGGRGRPNAADRRVDRRAQAEFRSGL